MLEQLTVGIKKEGSKWFHWSLSPARGFYVSPRPWIQRKTSKKSSSQATGRIIILYSIIVRKRIDVISHRQLNIKTKRLELVSDSHYKRISRRRAIRSVSQSSADWKRKFWFVKKSRTTRSRWQIRRYPSCDVTHNFINVSGYAKWLYEPDPTWIKLSFDTKKFPCNLDDPPSSLSLGYFSTSENLSEAAITAGSSTIQTRGKSIRFSAD